MNVYIIFENDERFYNNQVFVKVVDSEEKAKEIIKNKDFTYEVHKVE